MGVTMTEARQTGDIKEYTMKHHALYKAGQFYAQALVRLLIEPGRFFKDLPNEAGLGRTLGFMLISCLFFTIASLLTGAFLKPAWLMAACLFLGSSGTILMASFLGFITMVMGMGKTAGFVRVLSVYTFATGITLFVSWLPFFLWLSEPWKWWLIYLGFKNSCRASGRQAFVIVLISAIAQYCLLISAVQAFGR